MAIFEGDLLARGHADASTGGMVAIRVVRIVADRFGVTRDDRTIDLVTGLPVVLKIRDGGEPPEQAQWSVRCDRFHTVHHPRFAMLVDYGAFGRSQRFEAWQCGPPWKGARAVGEQTTRAARRYLGASGLTDHAASPAKVYDVVGRACAIPPDEWGYPREADHSPPVATLDECGISIVFRSASGLFVDLFASLSGARPHVVSIWGPPGSGRTTMALDAARVARRHGVVPIGASLLAHIDPGLVHGRQVCLISDASREMEWTALLALASASPRGHVLINFGTTELAGVHGVGLDPISAEVLAAAVRPTPLGLIHQQVERAAIRARGLPGRFAQLLWRSRTAPPVRAGGCLRRVVSRVAEQQPAYGAEGADAAVHERPQRQWPVPGELLALHRRSEDAAALLANGRHEPGVRQLRQSIGGLVRRRDWAHAADSMRTLASAMLARGAARDALTTLGEARTCAERAGLEALLVDIAVMTCHAWVDLAQLDEAETAGTSALLVARRTADGPRAARASHAVGRCLFWKGQYGESLASLTSPAGVVIAPPLSVSTKAAAARAAVGLGDLTQAMSLAREATDEASWHRDPRSLSLAFRAAAFVHLALGDVDSVQSDVRSAVAAARAAHDPMSSIRARLLLAECRRRLGRAPASAAFIQRLHRVGAAHLPPIVRIRVQLLYELMRSGADARDLVSRHTSRTGVAALSLYAGSPHNARAAESDRTEEIIGLLHLCQTAQDEDSILVDVCSRLRQQLRAAGAAVFGSQGSDVTVVASGGSRTDAEVAARAVRTEATVAPHRLNDRLESAAPIRYGGVVIGALAARWPLGTPHDVSRASTVLTLAATAAAPILSAALARRSRAAAPGLGELSGVTPAIIELRSAIERAAPVPFTVLIEGESGSGKELVAKAIHRASPGRDRPFCTLNCAALPDDLIEAELFGHARGAFTGAIQERAGVFEDAHGGTLFLDEVGELSLRAQAKLLRVIQEGELRRIGENHLRRVDVRLVAATNRDLRQDVADGRFRLDLLYRLDVIRLVVPPLRDRRDDIPVLAERFWQETTQRIGSRAVLTAATTAALARYDWPGNVRELQNILAALAVRVPRRGVVPPGALPPQFGEARRAQTCRLDDARRGFEERFVRAALVRSGGRRRQAAAELGVTRQGLTKLMIRLGI